MRCRFVLVVAVDRCDVALFQVIAALFENLTITTTVPTGRPCLNELGASGMQSRLRAAGLLALDPTDVAVLGVIGSRPDLKKALGEARRSELRTAVLSLHRLPSHVGAGVSGTPRASGAG